MGKTLFFILLVLALGSGGGAFAGNGPNGKKTDDTNGKTSPQPTRPSTGPSGDDDGDGGEKTTVSTPIPGVNSGGITIVSKPISSAPGVPVKTSGTSVNSPTSNPTTGPSAAVTPPTTQTTPTSQCQDEVLTKLTDLIKGDSAGVIGMMFELTAMRLAKRALQDQSETNLEELVKHQIDGLKGKIKGSKNLELIQKQVLEAYRQQGLQKDLDRINKDFTDLNLEPLDDRLNKNTGVCYYDPGLKGRLRNDESSAFIMAVVIGESGTYLPDQNDESRLTDIDASTVWAVERIRDAASSNHRGYNIGNANGNLMNISTRVAFYLGTIDDGRNVESADAMDVLIQGKIDELKNAIKLSAKSLKISDLKTCDKESINNNCPVCSGSTAKKIDDYINTNFDAIQRGLLRNIAGDTADPANKAKITIDDLHGKIGNTVFDLSDYAKPSQAKGGEKSANPNRGHDEKNSTCKEFRKWRKAKKLRNK